MVSLHQLVFSLALLVRLGVAQVQIETTAGPVNGMLKELDGEQYRSFLGIPYAEKPGRFKPPVSKSPWNETLEVMDYGPSCPQDIIKIDEVYDGRDYLFDIPEGAKEISEDCLTLNIFTPDEINPVGAEKHAVMVWIHGGDFEVGQGAAYDGAALTTRGRVVVVTLNYRLGPFGLLSTLDQHSTGNYAFLDQQLALNWIKRDIAKFGGDPSRITLFGQSTGGLSVSLHLFSPRSQGLFQRAIAESLVGTPWNLDEGFREPLGVAREFGVKVGCTAGHNRPMKSNSQLVECLRNSTLESLLDGWRIVKKHPWRTTWGPVIDGEFLPAPSSEDSSAIDTYVVTDHDLVIGVNTVESSSKQITEVDGISNLATGLTQESWEDVLESILADFGDQQGLVTSSVKQLYTDWDMYGDDIARLQQALHLIGDMNNVLRVYDFLTSWTSGDVTSSVFTYVFDHKTESESNKISASGAPHSEEIPYVWGAPFNGELMGYFTEDEKELSDTVMAYWTNFAKSGDPNLNSDQPAAAAINDLPNWPDYDSDDMTYLHLDASNETTSSSGAAAVAARTRYRWQHVHFWTETLPSLLDESTCPVVDEEECITRIGEELGWNLTPKDAILVLRILLGLCIAFLCLILMVGAVACGYREAVKTAQYGSPKGKWGYLSKTRPTSPLRRETSDLWKINHGYIHDPDLEDDTHL